METNEKTTMVISAFPACGKTWMHESSKDKVILDSDSSEFSWITNEKGEKMRNPEFPENYIAHIKSNIGKVDIIFVSSHLTVRQALTYEGINYITVYPYSDIKEEWIGRCFCRGNDIAFLNFINSSWDKFMEDIYNEPFGDELYRLGREEHLSDIIDKIESDWIMRIYSEKKSSEFSKGLLMSEEEISTLVKSFKESGHLANVAAYRLRKTSDNTIGLSAKISLGPVTEFYRRPDCPFIKNNYEGGFMVWIGGNIDSIHKFCNPYRKVFDEMAKVVAEKLNIEFSLFDESNPFPLAFIENPLAFIENVNVEYKKLVISFKTVNKD